ncbi:MAG: class I SAM-dependent methyltransferase [Candidatus Hydrogenedentes bacterium]|nr:class I SAM-dependent methyltransferase [Candidatus Hydrogenedentota bacterium]
MGFYSRYVFPRMMDMVMSSGQMSRVRAAVLSGVSGDVFEIGVGTGLNLAHYPAHVTELTTADPNAGMCGMAQRRIHARGMKVTHHTVGGENLPIEDASFDCVVCTWTLCSIPKVEQALREVHRILRPGGKLHFVEHGLADDDRIRRWQHRLTPIQKIVSDGCHFNRDICALIQSQRFRFETIENYYLRRVPKFAGYLYQGIACKD